MCTDIFSSTSAESITKQYTILKVNWQLSPTYVDHNFEIFKVPYFIKQTCNVFKMNTSNKLNNNDINNGNHPNI